MSRRTNDKIRKEHLILCEGRDAEEFLIAFLNSKALAETPAFSNDIQVMDFGGNEQLEDRISILKNMEGFELVKSIVIIRDAERNPEGAIDTLRATLKKCGLPVPEASYQIAEGQIKTGYVLFPTCTAEVRQGTLEDLCLSILAESNNEVILAEIDTLIQNLSDKYGRKFPHEFKTKLHSYFSVTDDFVALKIGEAARANAFNWYSEKLIPLKEFILSVIS